MEPCPKLTADGKPCVWWDGHPGACEGNGKKHGPGIGKPTGGPRLVKTPVKPDQK